MTMTSIRARTEGDMDVRGICFFSRFVYFVKLLA